MKNVAAYVPADKWGNIWGVVVDVK
jgi:hypothetical protein